MTPGSRITILYVTLPGWLIFAGALGSLMGAFVPWATVSAGSGLKSILGLSFSFSISALDIEAAFGWAIVLSGLVAAAAVLKIAATRVRSPGAALLATVAALTSALAAVLVANRAQEAGASVSWVGSLIDTTALINISPGVGFWLVFGGSLVGIAGGVLAYFQR
jgi:hypothetical protein